MRPEIDLHVMQEIGTITRASGPAVEPLSLDIASLLEDLRSATPTE